MQYIIYISPSLSLFLLQDILRRWDSTLIDGENVWRSLMRSAVIGQRVRLGVIREQGGAPRAPREALRAWRAMGGRLAVFVRIEGFLYA